jgi:hypothetical protein
MIWASTESANPANPMTDVDVIVRISDVTPSGRVELITDGIQRGRFVFGYDQIRPLTPGQPVLFDVPMGPIAVRLAAGHALRVSISETSAPRYEQNPGVARPLVDANPPPTTGWLRVHRDATHPSAITFPVLMGPQGDGAAGASATTALGVAPDSTPSAPNASGSCACRLPGDATDVSSGFGGALLLCALAFATAMVRHWARMAREATTGAVLSNRGGSERRSAAVRRRGSPSA